MKTASFNIAILNFFSRHGQYFHPTKDQPRTRPSSTFLYICYNFRQIFCTNVIQFFSVENMGHNQLQKCTKYHLVSLLNEKQGSTFANFLHFFYPVTLLTHSAVFLEYFPQKLLQLYWSTIQETLKILQELWMLSNVTLYWRLTGLFFLCILLFVAKTLLMFERFFLKHR